MLGILAFFLALLILVLIHEYGHFKAARIFGVGVEEFGFGFPPTAYAKKIGETIYSLNWLPLGGFVRIKGEDSQIKSYDSFSAQPVWKRLAIVAAGVVMNLVLAIILFSVGYGIGLPQEIATAAPAGAIVRNLRHEIVAVLPKSPAARVFVPGDEIININGQTFSGRTALQEYIRSHANSDLSVTYRHQGNAAVVNVRPAPLDLPEAAAPVYGLGIELVTSGTVTYPAYLAPVAATITVAKLFGLIGSTLWGVVHSLVVRAPVGVEVAGPIGIAVLSGQVAELGFVAYLQFIALLSINLAFVNLIPFPALDGGRLLFLVIEGVRRRPVSSSLEMRIHRWGFVILNLWNQARHLVGLT